MIFVSTKFPEEIPWFSASRRGVVAAMSVDRVTSGRTIWAEGMSGYFEFSHRPGPQREHYGDGNMNSLQSVAVGLGQDVHGRCRKRPRSVDKDDIDDELLNLREDAECNK